MPTAVATIDLEALRSNARNIIRWAAPARVIAVVKADAYGHGAVRVTRALTEVGIDFFAVATVEEGVELREAGIDDRILVMGALLPHEVHRYLEHGLDATIGSEAGLQAVLGLNAKPELRVHLKIDTGMGRIGLDPESARSVLPDLRSAQGAELVALSSHLSSADADDLSFSNFQLDRFAEALAEEDLSGLSVHIANTEGLARLENAFRPFSSAMVRIGIGLYGCPIRPDAREALGLIPVMTVRALVTNLKRVEPGTPISYNRRWTADRETTIATVGIGYADGYRRSMAGAAEVAVAGRRHPVVGVICMDMIMVDLGPDPVDIGIGDAVILFGQGGPDVSEVAGWAGTISYEITSCLGPRVERRYE